MTMGNTYNDPAPAHDKGTNPSGWFRFEDLALGNGIPKDEVLEGEGLLFQEVLFVLVSLE